MAELWPTAHITELCLQLTAGSGPADGDEHRALESQSCERAMLTTEDLSLPFSELRQRLSPADGTADSTVQSMPRTHEGYNSLSLADDDLRPPDGLTSSTQTCDIDCDVEVNVVDDGPFSAAASFS